MCIRIRFLVCNNFIGICFFVFSDFICICFFVCGDGGLGILYCLWFGRFLSRLYLELD